MPEWVVELGDVFHDPEVSFEDGRDRIVQRLRKSEWLCATPSFELIHIYVEELSRATGPTEFTYAFNSILDEAAYARVLISTNVITKGDRP